MAANGVSSLVLALIGWLLWKNVGVDAAIGVAIAGYTAMAGWRMLVSPAVSEGGASRHGPPTRIRTQSWVLEKMCCSAP